jgi:tetratricopeptide (TPR) repeat protein
MIEGENKPIGIDALINRFLQAIEQDPQNARLHYELANALQEQKRFDDALVNYRRALQLHPHYVEALNNMANMLCDMGRLDEAVSAYRLAIQVNPKIAILHYNLGTTLRDLGHLEPAVDAFRQAVACDPRLAVAYNNLGNALRDLDQQNEAVKALQQAVILDPKYVDAYNNLGTALEDLGHLEKAILAYGKALKLQPDYALGYYNLGKALNKRGDLTEAVDCLQRSLQLSQDFVAAHCQLGEVFGKMGEFEKALACFREAIRLDPDHCRAFADIAKYFWKELLDNDVTQMERLIQKPDLTLLDRSTLSFALASTFDRRKNYKRAVEEMSLANRHRKESWLAQRGTQYSAREHTEFVDTVISTFDVAYFRRVQGLGLTTDVPVFIVGMPRSGTSLIEQILASHPQVHGGGELRFAGESMESLPQLVADRCGKQIGFAGLCPIDYVSHLNDSDFHKVATEHFQKLVTLDGDAGRIVDKMPDNYLTLGWIVSLFPEAYLIHCRRDVRDVAVSCWQTDFETQYWSCDQDNIIHRIRDYQRLMDHWRQVLPVRMLEVDYEETVDDLQNVARRLIDWIDLEWDPACIAFHKTKRPVLTASFNQVRQPLYSRSVGRWRNYRELLSTMFEGLE